MNSSVHNIVKSARAKKVNIKVPVTTYGTIKLVHTLCSAANAKVWSPECEKALVDNLPVREHHKAFLSHNMFVTMIGAVVARSLEQATRHCEDTLDLLADRHFVRSIACHDSSKTSATEAAAYAGIIAVHMEKEALRVNAKKRHQLNKRHGVDQPEDERCSLDNLHTDTGALTTAMANFGFKHHYENNPHHPEHFPGCKMDDMNLVEAIVDGLACIFERNKEHTDVDSWLGMYYVDRFKDDNKKLAVNIMRALRIFITDADYKALQAFQRSIVSIIGESIPWSRVIMTDPCEHIAADHNTRVPAQDYLSCFPVTE